jgi:drug/metabolite transporter (DMT)-like permease
MALSLACFAANSLLLKGLADAGGDAWLALAVRSGGGLLVLVVWFTPDLGRCLRHPPLVARGVLGGLSTACFYLSIGPLGAGKATLIGTTWPAFAALAAVFFLGEPLSPTRAAGIALALGGLALLTGTAGAVLAPPGLWEGIGLAGAIMAAAVILFIRQLIRTESSATIFGAQCVYGLLLSAPVAAWGGRAISAAEAAGLSLAALAAIAGQLAMTEGFRHLSVAAGGALQLLTPLVVTAGGVLWFGEAFAPAQALGAALILAGTFTALRR